MHETWVLSLDQEDPLEKEMEPMPVFLPGESHGQMNLVGYSPWTCKESDTSEWLSTHTHIVTVAMGRYVIQAGENWLKQPSEQCWSGPNTAWAFPSSKQRRVELRLQTIRHMAVLKNYHLLHDGKYKKIIKCKEFLSEQIFSNKLFCAPFQFCKMLIKRLDINSHEAQILVG